MGGSVLAHQLLRLGQMHGRVGSPALAKTLATVVPVLYRAISELGPDEFEVRAVLC